MATTTVVQTVSDLVPLLLTGFGGPGGSVVKKGVLSGATGTVDLTPAAFASLQYLRLEILADAFNGGALCQLAVAWNGPALSGYVQGGYWSAGAAAATPPAYTNLGTYGGNGVLIDQDQINASVPRTLIAEFFKGNKSINAHGTVFDTTGTASFQTRVFGRTGSATALTGISILLGANTVSGTYTITGY